MLKHTLFIALFLFIGILLLGGVLYFQSFKQGFALITGLVFNKNIELKKTDDDIYVLLLGIGGGTHDGPDLTDTIILADIKPVSDEVNFISIPRDLWIPDLKAKINSAYATGQEKGQGILRARSVLASVTGKETDYTIVVDFAGFVKMIDMLGGVDVNVQQSFDDYAYPVTGKETDVCGRTQEEVVSLSAQIATGSATEFASFPCRYQHIHFDKGVMHMDGENALEFVRSRHALGEEGTDFARSGRQHEVLAALKDKLFSLGTLSNPIKLIGIYNLLKDNMNTDVPVDQIDDFVKLAQKMKNAVIHNYVLDTGDKNPSRYGLLTNPLISDAYGSQWVLVPRTGNGNFAEIRSYISCVTAGKICVVEKNSIAAQTISPQAEKH